MGVLSLRPYYLSSARLLWMWYSGMVADGLRHSRLHFTILSVAEVLVAILDRPRQNVAIVY
jgi:hypothetical protein